MKGVSDYVLDLANPDVEVRRHAVTQLAHFGRPAIDHLFKALNDRDPLVAAAAISSFRWLGDSGCVSRLIAILDQKNELLIAEAAEVLGDLGDQSALPALRKAARDPDFPGRAEVLRALGAFSGHGLEKELLPLLLETDEPEEAAACAEALTELKCYEATPLIMELYYQLDGSCYQDDLIRCLAALVGKPEFFSEGEIDLAAATDYFASLVQESLAEAPAKLRKIYQAVLQALQKKSSQRFYKTLGEALLSTICPPLVGIGLLKESDYDNEEKIVQKLINTRIGAILSIVSALIYKKEISEAKYTGKDLELAILCTSATWEELARIIPEKEPDVAGKTANLAELITEMVISSTVKPRFLIKKIISCGEEAVIPLKSVLREHLGKQAGYWAAEALGQINTPGAVAALLEVMAELEYNYDDEEDEGTTRDTIQEALAFCGEKAIAPTIRKIREWAKTGSVQNVVYAGGALAKIRHPEVFAFLLGQLEQKSPAIRCAALGQLAEYGDPAAIFHIRRLLSGEDEEVVEAAQAALVELCANNGVTFPGLAELREEVAEKKFRRLTCDLFDPDEEFTDDDEDSEWTPYDDEEPEQFVLDEEDEEAMDYRPPEPVVKPPKVGRNDPCPCGSGKKYKKCCGKSGN